MMLQFLGWVALTFGLLNLLSATVLFPLVRRFNHWTLGWFNHIVERQKLPFVDIQERLKWWIAQEGLQRTLGIAMAAILFVAGWFIWASAQ
jgi:hypothetical protein